MKGKIIKGIAGFYYVHVPGAGVYACKAKGIFRKEGIKPLVGDDVEIAVLDEQEKEGSLQLILPRKNQLIRPASANVDQALVIFAAASPEPNLNLLDRFLISMAREGIPAAVCFNKTDLAGRERLEQLAGIYENCGCPVFFASAVTGEGMEELRRYLENRTTVVAGPSGVGKSSMTNRMQPEADMEVGAVSRKIGRGKQTTRHAQLVCVKDGTYLMDTPGFSSFYLQDMDKEELREYYREFLPYEPECRFQGCMHIHEPDCGVKRALAEGKIHPARYESYQILVDELKENRRY